MKYVAFAFCVAFPLAAAAQPAPSSISDCERIKGDLAYNQCLAMFGPKVGERRSSGVAPPVDEDEPAAQRGGASRTVARRGPRGRMTASFEIGSRTVQPAAVRATPTYPKRSHRRRRR